jgi:hypothetical protein
MSFLSASTSWAMLFRRSPLVLKGIAGVDLLEPLELFHGLVSFAPVIKPDGKGFEESQMPLIGLGQCFGRRRYDHEGQADERQEKESKRVFLFHNILILNC